MKKKIIIFSGDPNSVNSELIYKSFIKLKKEIRKKVYLITNYELFKMQLKKLNYSLNLVKFDNSSKKINPNTLKVINVKLKFSDSFNVEKTEVKRFIKNSLNLSHKYGLKKDVSGIINCSINKRLLDKKYLGVTEYFASKCKIKKNSEAMLIYNENLSVSPVTTHIKLRNVSKKISSKLIFSKIMTINKEFLRIFHKKPKIAILGLNPHNAEYNKDSEEIKIILPALKKLKKSKISIFGPLVTDTVFIKDYLKYDVIVGMYHDQILTPFKSIYKFDAFNLTLGLKYLRVSPDHGTAVNLIGKNKANPISLIKCINFLNRFSS
tara:strand:- start:4174 stop:5139 length:966 start_codon:yes stop_codon:yes gene_type:complete